MHTKEKGGGPSPHARPGRVAPWIATLLALSTVAPAAAQQVERAPRRLSLRAAVRLARKGADPVRIAKAAVGRAEGNEGLVAAQRLPQINATAAYTRTLASQFRQAFQSAASDSSGSSPFGGASFSKLGFGSENAYNLGLAFSWRLFDGGALSAQSRSAEASHSSAEIGLTSAEAELVLDVTRAYYDAQLAARMVDIERASLEQADDALKVTTAEQQQGRESEFDVLRARVDRDNQRPILIQRETSRDVAFFRLKQLLNLPLDEPLVLTDSLQRMPDGVDSAGVATDPPPEARAPVRQAQAEVAAARGQLDEAEAERLPGLSLTSSYGRVEYPQALAPAWSDFRTNWTVGFALDLPIFEGGRIGSQELTARAGLESARARLDQTRKQAALDTYQAQAELKAAQASWKASQGTVEEARRAYKIAKIRYREGLSTQLELSNARLLLEQARGNRAQAARDLHVALTRVRLLPSLPLSTAAGGAGASSAQAGSTTAATASTGTTTGTGAAAASSSASGRTAAGGGAMPVGVPGTGGGR